MNFDEEIKRTINQKFPQLDVSIFSDETQDNIIVAIDDDVYYSDDYLSLIMDIKMNLLWKNNIFNYLFVKERHTEWVHVATPAVLNNAADINISFSVNHDGRFTTGYSNNYSREGEIICLQAA
jgi:hypothetical protein